MGYLSVWFTLCSQANGASPGKAISSSNQVCRKQELEGSL